jgi:serine/threonine protein kinase
MWLVLLATASGGKRHKDRKRAKHSRIAPSTSSDLKFPRESEPINRGDKTLIKLIRKYVSIIYPSGANELSVLHPILSNPDGEEPFRAQRVLLRWSPVECKSTQLKLRKAGTIHGDHYDRRNRVYKMYDTVGKGLYAWKLFKNPDEYTAELSFFVVSDHPNIVKAICVQRDSKSGNPGLLIDYVGGGSSMDFAKRNADDPDKLQRLSAQVYDVIKYMHWLGFIHADLKPENVMIDEEGNAKAIDFGFAIPIPFYKFYRGTRSTVAPELVKAVHGPILENIDMWALGSTIAQWYGVGVMPISTTGSKRSHKWVPVRISKSSGYRFGRPPTRFSDPLKQLMFFLMNPEPTLRMFNTKTQLDWFESLAFWQGVNFNKIGYNWSHAE